MLARIGCWFLTISKDIILSYLRSPTDYNIRGGQTRQLSKKELAEKRKEHQALRAEIDEFLRGLRDRLPGNWTLGEQAAYESIRRREAQL